MERRGTKNRKMVRPGNAARSRRRVLGGALEREHLPERRTACKNLTLDAAANSAEQWNIRQCWHQDPVSDALDTTNGILMLRMLKKLKLQLPEIMAEAKGFTTDWVIRW